MVRLVVYVSVYATESLIVSPQILFGISSQYVDAACVFTLECFKCDCIYIARAAEIL